MQNAALITVTGCTHDTNIKHLHDETPILPIHPSHKHTTYFNTSMLKNIGCYITNVPRDPHTDTTIDIKTNMRHMHASFVSMHLATRGYNQILRTPPPHISCSEEILPCLTRRTLAQLRTNKSPFLKSYLPKVDAKSH